MPGNFSHNVIDAFLLGGSFLSNGFSFITADAFPIWQTFLVEIFFYDGRLPGFFNNALE